VEKDTKDLTALELTNSEFISSIFNNYDGEERVTALNEVLETAKKRKVLKMVKAEINKYDLGLKVEKNTGSSLEGIALKMDENGNIDNTIDNFLRVIQNDNYSKDWFKFDVFSNKIVCVDKETKRERSWNDNDDSALRHHLETEFGLYNQQKYYDAFNTSLNLRKYHPIKDIIEEKKWDGIPRIDRFLTDILKCEDSDYSREVSRMIFYGGISRLYNPGCKFDYMPIFIGRQGSGKSTVIKWLALDDKYYTDLPTIEGKDALEILQGSWLCEMAELLAMVRTKDVEAMKGFITKTNDRYRPSYGRHTVDYPRQCIFIGTTNDYQFLSDGTGNRRYLPIEIQLKRGELFNKEKEIKKYILECWREALVLFNEGKTYLTIPNKYYSIIEEKQSAAEEDDPKKGLILSYLDKKEIGEKVCGMEIFTKCLNEIKKNYTRMEAKEITRIMNSQADWVRGEKAARLGDYGVQRYWEKIDVEKEFSDLE
jgi:predicted P-loop ATPase